MQRFLVKMGNTSGVLDSEVVVVKDGEDTGALLKAAVISMVESYPHIDPGDVFSVESL